MRQGMILVLVGLVGCAGEAEHASGEAAIESRAGVCSGQQQMAAFEAMVNAPILPPRMFGGIDLAGAKWEGQTLDGAERTLCQAQPGPDVDPTTAEAGWGLAPNQQMRVTYDKATKVITGYELHPGYKGKLEFRSRRRSIDGSAPNPFGDHTYSLGIGTPILRDGQPWTIHWARSCTPGPETECWQRELTELFDGAMAAFAPELRSTQGNCVAEQLCLGSKRPSGQNIFGVRPLGFYVVTEPVGTETAPTSPAYFYGVVTKTMPFTSADAFLKLDGDGPRVTALGLGEARRDCSFGLGSTYGAFVDGCVAVQTQAPINAMLTEKLLGGATRTISTDGAAPRGTWLLPASGIAPGFDSERFDERAPTSHARMTTLTFDQRWGGRPLNDSQGIVPTLTATGAIYLAYAEMVQAWLQAHSAVAGVNPRRLGAAECFSAPGARPAAGCTGMEQFMIPIDPSAVTDPDLQRISVGTSQSHLGLRTTLKPGFLRGAFCADPGVFDRCFGEAAAQTEGRTGALFTTTLAQVTAVLGDGRTDLLPEEARTPQFYARMWAKAVVTYLNAASQHPVTLHGLPAPSDEEIKLETPSPDRLVARYQNRLELEVDLAQPNVTEGLQRMTFR